jgi:ribonuclease HI
LYRANQGYLLIMNNIILYTDGSSRGNPGPGGYGAILMWGTHRKELAQGYRLTTNNRMELLAVIEGLKALKKNHLPVTVYSDSQYVVNAVQKGWLANWIKTDFKGGKKNADLWKTYYQLAKNFRISFVWVKGHANNPYNNRCDELATAAADSKQWLVDEGYENEA